MPTPKSDSVTWKWVGTTLGAALVALMFTLLISVRVNQDVMRESQVMMGQVLTRHEERFDWHERIIERLVDKLDNHVSEHDDG